MGASRPAFGAAGLDGLTGMRPSFYRDGVTFVRPFLQASRADLLASLDRAITRAAEGTAQDARFDENAGRLASLTERQRAVLDMVLAGQPSKNIATDLGISQRTVESHRAHIMQRLGVRTIPELVRAVLSARPG